MADLAQRIRERLETRPALSAGECTRAAAVNHWISQERAAIIAVLELAETAGKYGPIMVPEGVEGRVRLERAAASQEALEGAVNVIAEKLGIEVKS